MLEQCCTERFYAEDAGEFAYIRDRDGWCFTDGPLRRMTFKAAYLAYERGGENHDGEPFSWHCCPWCGADLPIPTEPRHPFHLDGDDGG